MSNYDNTNRGIFSRNEKRTKDTQAEFTGTGNLDGVEFWINGWVKEKKDGSGKFFSLSFKRKEQLHVPLEHSEPKSLAQELDDDIPF